MKRPKRLNKLWAVCTLCLAAACNNEKPAAVKTEDKATGTSPIPTVINYSIVNEYAHDPAAFTEGLEYKDGFLYEGTGQYGESDLRKTDLKTGKVLASSKLEDRYFGEGITILNGKIYQLTYKEGKGFIYDIATLKQTGTFTVKTQEGWGMTNNGSQIIFDDGSNTLHFIDPATFKEVKTLAVIDDQGPVMEINEPELIKGYIYANQWKTDLILKIDTLTGRVVGRTDLSAIREQAGIGTNATRSNGPDVLNGIAYDAAGNRIFITGKYWPKLFEIKLDN